MSRKTLRPALRFVFSRLCKATSQNPFRRSFLRVGSIPGTHEVAFDSPEDTLLFRHTARNRDGFARGALLAAELIQDKPGFFEFQELLFDEE